ASSAADSFTSSEPFWILAGGSWLSPWLARAAVPPFPLPTAAFAVSVVAIFLPHRNISSPCGQRDLNEQLRRLGARAAAPATGASGGGTLNDRCRLHLSLRLARRCPALQAPLSLASSALRTNWTSRLRAAKHGPLVRPRKARSD